MWPDWEVKAKGCVAHLRAIGGSDADSPELAELVGELIVKSPDFNRLWQRYEVRALTAGQKTFHHPEVGTLTLNHESLSVGRREGQRLVVYMAEPGSADHDAMVLLDMAGLESSTRPAEDRTTRHRVPREVSD